MKAIGAPPWRGDSSVIMVAVADRAHPEERFGAPPVPGAEIDPVMLESLIRPSWPPGVRATFPAVRPFCPLGAGSRIISLLRSKTQQRQFGSPSSLSRRRV